MHRAGKLFAEKFRAMQRNRNGSIAQLGAKRICGIADLPEDLSAYVRYSFDFERTEKSRELAILGVTSIRSKYSLDAKSLPGGWITGISTFYPERNSMSGLSGTAEERNFIREHRISRGCFAIGAARLPKADCWYIDIEGADIEVARQIFLHQEPQLLLCEHALAEPDDALELRALAVVKGYKYFADEENILFYRPAQ
jgi:hypothetical protein